MAMSVPALGRGQGEVLSETTEIKGAREELVVVEFTYPAGKSGPDPHVHREHSDCFWVLEGELRVELGPDGESRRAGPGTFVLVPPGVVHTFRNESPGVTRFVNVHAPGKEFDDYLRALTSGGSYDFDSFDAPEDGGRPAAEALVVEPHEGEEIALGPTSLVIKAGQEHGTGAVGLNLVTVGAGSLGPALHVHEHTVASFYVLDGTLTLRFADSTAEAGPGAYALMPPGTAHGFANQTDKPVRFLNVMAPADAVT